MRLYSLGGGGDRKKIVIEAKEGLRSKRERNTNDVKYYKGG